MNEQQPLEQYIPLGHVILSQRLVLDSFPQVPKVTSVTIVVLIPPPPPPLVTRSMVSINWLLTCCCAAFRAKASVVTKKIDINNITNFFIKGLLILRNGGKVISLVL